MLVESVTEKLYKLPEAYIEVVDNYIDQLLEKSKKIDALKGSLSSYANPELASLEKKAFEKAMVAKHAEIN